LTQHRIGVDLTHVVAVVAAADVADVQRPRVQVGVHHRQPVVVGQDQVVHCQDSLVVGFDPGHLLIRTSPKSSDENRMK